MAETVSAHGEVPWAQAARWVESELGLHFAPRQWPDLERGFHAAAQRLGLPGTAGCVQHALAQELDARQKQVLAECLAIGETYFFRDPALFEQLAARILPPLLAARASGTRTLRFWSAGCSSGEEPYSLAMLVAGMLPDWREWDISILATDINRAALDKGRTGAYGRWSFRGPLPEGCETFLREGGDGRRHVVPALRRLVRFAPLNLVTGDYPSPRTLTTAMDLVLCRNVLIYFEPARAAAVLERLGGALAGDGWLVTGSVEMPSQRLRGLQRVQAGSVFALRRSAHAAAPPQEKHPAMPPLPAPAPRAVRPTPAPAPAVPADTTPVGAPAPGLLQRARALADGGELAGAERLCREAMAGRQLDPEASYLLASILREAGDADGAAAALQRTLYLDSGHLMARFALGTLLRGRGEERAGRAHLARALAQLAGLPPDTVLPGAGGITARELENAIRCVLPA